VDVREVAAKKLGEWGSAQSTEEMNSIERLMEAGYLQDALKATQKILQRCLTAGENAYPEAAYNISRAYFRLGRILRFGGATGDALASLAEAQNRFQALADAGDTSAAKMASAAITVQADCLRDLGRLDEAAATYQKAINLDEKRGDFRDVAVGKGQLGTVRLYQRRYPEALAAWEETRSIFKALNEPESVATAWHQIGIVHRHAGNAEAAERAYRQSLAIKVARGDWSGQASSLSELGNLYNNMSRLEEAVAFYRQAADIHTKIGNLRYEGAVRANTATSLLKLKLYAEARQELLRAIECDKPFGHAAEPWKTWRILQNLEEAIGNPEAAAQAQEGYEEDFFGG
jgi:tetratricopeptide (TPR) repeat protein